MASSSFPMNCQRGIISMGYFDMYEPAEDFDENNLSLQCVVFQYFYTVSVCTRIALTLLHKRVVT